MSRRPDGPREESRFALNDDVEFDRRQWKVQRVSWWVMLVVLIAALAGLFGNGVLSRARATDAGGSFAVQYERFQRFQLATPLRIRSERVPPDGRVRLWLDRKYVQGHEVEWITPRPVHEILAPDRVIYEFTINDPARPPIEIVIRLRPDDTGLQTARLGLEGGPEVTFHEFVYP